MDLTPARREILNAAADCFMEQGFHATSIDVVARRMGATKGRVYHHYPSKMDLFFDVHRLGMQLLFDAMEPARDGPGDALQVLAAMMRAHALALFEHHAFDSVMVQGVHLHRFGATTPAQRVVLDELIASRDRFEQLFRQQLVLGQQQGLIADVNPSIAVKTLLGGLQWYLVWYRPERCDSLAQRKQLAQAMVQTLVEGLRARVGIPPSAASVKRVRRSA